MFKKKTCGKCSEKVSEKHSFCPNCGAYLSKEQPQEDMGMLGTDDNTPQKDDTLMTPFGGISGKLIGKMVNSAMKMMEKEISREFSKMENQPRKITPKTNMRLMINGKEVNLNSINKNNQPPKEKPQEKLPNNIPLNKLKKMSGLEKEEPETNLKRLDNKVIYELKMPEIKSIEDVSIVRLENSIEIKALGKTKVYSKLIPINLPITKYDLEKGKLILELEAK